MKIREQLMLTNFTYRIRNSINFFQIDEIFLPTLFKNASFDACEYCSYRKIQEKTGQNIDAHIIHGMSLT